MTLHDPLADGEPDAGACILLTGVQALKQAKDACEISGLDANAVVGHGEPPDLCLLTGVHMHQRWFVAAKLDRVTHQVLKKLSQLTGVCIHRWQVAMRDTRLAFLDRFSQVSASPRKSSRSVSRGKDTWRGTHPGISQQIINQRLHALAAANRMGNELVGPGIQGAAIAFFQQLHTAADRAQRLLQVMRRHVGKLLKLGVGAGQFPVGGFQVGLGLLSSCDVFSRRQRSRGHPLGIAQHGVVPGHVEQLPLGIHNSIFIIVRCRRIAVHQGLEHIAHCSPIFGGQKIPKPIPAQQQALGFAQHLCALAVD